MNHNIYRTNLSNESIDLISNAIQEHLSGLNHDKTEILRVRLSCEEALIDKRF